MHQVHNIKTGNYVVISGFVAVSALNTAEKVMNSTGQVVVLSAVSALFGITPTAGQGFACTSKGLYFVHYRLRARRNDVNSAVSCIMSLFVGSDEIKVSYSMDSCICKKVY